MVYFTHDPEILRLTDQHGIKATEIAVSKTEDALDQSHEAAVNEQSRDAVVRYWSVFMRDYVGPRSTGSRTARPSASTWTR